MTTRLFDGIPVGDMGLGCWQIGGSWGEVSDEDALSILRTAYQSGTTFFDTADVYGMGRSESLIGRWLREDKPDGVFVATKQGRFSPPGWPGNFTLETMREHVDASRARLGVDALDLVQLHCIPTDTLRDGAVFDHLRTLRAEGRIVRFGASVESMDEALMCLEQDGLASLQILFNLFRPKPAEVLFEKAAATGVAIIARVPLASGLLSGKFSESTVFGDDDHRNFNRDGAAFHVGETFAGVPFAAGVELAREVAAMVPSGWTLAQLAQRWILDHPAVTVVIPGASRPEQAAGNADISDLPRLDPELHARLTAWGKRRAEPLLRGGY
jgi:aryl-alcohol dehydrogenase-like predicted oxidoreductase